MFQGIVSGDFPSKLPPPGRSVWPLPLAGYLFCQLEEEKLGTISKGFIYPSNKMRGNENEKTQSSKNKAR